MNVNKPIFAMLDELRSSPLRLTPMLIASEAEKRGIAFDLDAFLDVMTRFSATEERSYSRVLLNFVGEFASALRPRSALDPWAGYGELLLSVNRRTQLDRAVGICAWNEQFELAVKLSDGAPIRWLVGPPAQQLELLDETFDFVTAFSPWNYGVRTKKRIAAGTVIEDDVGSLVNFLAIEKLDAHGKALLVVNSAFITAARQSGWFAQRADLGITLDALIHCPAGFFDHVKIGGYLCVFSKQPGDGQVFIGELSGSDSEQNKTLLDNLLERRPSSEMRLGRLHSGDFPGYQQLATIEKSMLAGRTMGLQPSPLRDIVLEINLSKSIDFADFPQRDNALFLPTIGRSRASVSTADLRLKPQNYAQIVLDPSLASAAYLASYFNTALGLQCREGMEDGYIPKLSKARIDTASIYVPDLKTQLHCVALESEALNLKIEIEDILQNLHRQPRKYRAVSQALRAINQDDSFERWLASLPFPLASALGVYHANSNDDKACYESLGHSFEALGEFVALILWSALASNADLLNHKKYPLKASSPLGNSVRKSSFGSWNEMAGRLAKFVRLLVNDRDTRLVVQAAFGDPLDLSSVEMLYDTSLITALESANAIRNRKAHGGIVGSEEARLRRRELESILATVRSSMSSSWLDFALYRAGSARLRADVFHCEAERAMGRATPFEKIIVPLNKPVEDGHLFLLPAGSTTPVVLKPLLRIGASPSNAQNACYFYNSQSGDRLRYVSYHFDQEAELFLNDEGSAAAVESLISSTG